MNQNTFFRKHKEATVINPDGSTKDIGTVRVGQQITVKDRQNALAVTIKAPCRGDEGRWYCVTHNEGFRNQLDKDVHISHGTHELAWLCFLHGYEQP